MTIFSEALMQKYFTTEEIHTLPYHSPWRAETPKPETKTYFRTKRTVKDWLSMAQELKSDPSSAGGEFTQYLKAHASHWAGFGEQSMDSVIKDGLIHEAIKAFEKANGQIDTHFARAQPQLSPVGGSFSVGRVMMGHPKAAIIRPKAKLPPKQIALTINVSAGVKQERIADAMSKIAKAAWQYISAGGIVELTVSFIHNFSRPQEWHGIQHHGILDTIKINPVNAAAYASAASGQFYRGPSMALACTLSGQRGDGLPLGKWGNPLSYPISGTPDDLKVLETLKVKS